MITAHQINALPGSALRSADGTDLGKVNQIFLDDQTDRADFATVSTGKIMKKEKVVPLAEATLAEEELTVPYDKDTLKDAPEVDTDAGLISPEEEAELYRYYGLATGTGTVETGRDVSGPMTDDAMTRSEERLDVGTDRRESGRARLRKYVVTEHVTRTVPVSHEEVRVEREPITETNAGQAMAGGDLTEEEHEVTLHEERPTVHKTTTPVERVRLGTETVTGTEEVGDDVRKEQVEVDAAEDQRR